MMKKTYYFIAALSIFFLNSCSNKYEDSIRAYIQADKDKATKLNISLKIKDTKKLRTITVADSVNYLTQKSELGQQAMITEIEESISKYQEIVVNGLDGKKLSRTLTEAYLAEIEKSKTIIDSIKSITPDPITEYQGRKANDVLAVIIKTVYEVENPNKEVLTSDFVLSPDGKICYGTTDNADMLPEK